MSALKVHGAPPSFLVLGACLAAVALSTSVFVLASTGSGASGSPAASPGGSAPQGNDPGLAACLAPPFPPGIVASVPVGSGPVAGVADPTDGWVYVANVYSNSVSVVNGTSVVATVDLTPNLTGSPLYVTYDSLRGYVYVVDRYDNELPGSGAVNVLRGTSVLATIPVGSLPVAATFDPSNGYLYVVNSGSANVTVIDGTVALGAVPVGRGPAAAAFDPWDGYVYVANARSANVSILFGAHLVGTLSAGVGPSSVAYDPLNAYVYVVNSGSNNATVYSDVSVVGNVPVGADPSFVAFNPSVGGVEVTNTNSSDVTVLNGTSVTGSAPVASGPVWDGLGPFGGFTFVVGEGANAVTYLRGTSCGANLTVGSVPVAGVSDPVHQFEYVLNSGSNNLTVLAVTYPVTFDETGLAPGVSWSVTLGSSVNASTSSSIGFVEPNGSFAYAVEVPAGYQLVSSVPPSPVTVAGQGVTVEVTFSVLPSRPYNLTFYETGLGTGCSSGGGWGGGGWVPASSPQCCRPSPLAWSVTVGGVTQTTTNTSVSFSELDGTYNYSILAPSGYSVAATAPSSPVTIHGADVSVNVTFTHASPAPSLSVRFQEFGLPWGTTWCVTLNGTECSSSRTIVFSGLAPGTYAFNVSAVSGYTAHPAQGSVTLSNRSVTVWVKFTSTGGHGCGG